MMKNHRKKRDFISWIESKPFDYIKCESTRRYVYRIIVNIYLKSRYNKLSQAFLRSFYDIILGQGGAPDRLEYFIGVPSPRKIIGALK